MLTLKAKLNEDEKNARRKEDEDLRAFIKWMRKQIREIELVKS